MAALTIYIDDSGTDPTQPFAIAAGWISPIEQWEKFEKDWRRIKAKPGYEFHCFHMSECLASNSTSEFCDWDDAKKERVIRKLRKIIRGGAIQGFAIALGKQDYDKLVTGDLRKEAGDTHYTWAFRGLISLIEAWRVQRSIKATIEFVFDWMERHDPRRKEIEAVFARADEEAKAHNRIGGYKGAYSFRKRCDLSPLQAADILALITYQRAQLEISGKKMHPLAEESFNELGAYDNQRWLEVRITNHSGLVDWVDSVTRKRGSKGWSPLVSIKQKPARKAPPA
jgi:uncharacterized protein DUF3800